MKPGHKKYLIIVGVVILLIIAGYWLFGKNKQTKVETTKPFPTEEVIPTVSSSVKIDLRDTANGKEVILSAGNIPSQTQTVDYELSYNTAQQGLQGVIGTINLAEGDSAFEKKITLGTCSSGTCVYHKVVGKIKLSLKFNGGYGEKVFEKEYEL